jgi:peroxiredoxin
MRHTLVPSREFKSLLSMLLIPCFPRMAIAGLLLLCVVPPVWAAEEMSLPVPSGEDVPVQRFTADGDSVFIWLPSEFGLRPEMQITAQALAGLGVEVWMADLHSAYFLMRGRSSIEKFQAADIAQLVEHARRRGKRHVFLLSGGRGAKPVLQAARHWQLTRPGSNPIRGLMLFYPSLYQGRPSPGEDASYLPVAKLTNLPILVIQPEFSTMYLRLPALVSVLSEGGSPVFVYPLSKVKDGYHARPDDHLSAADREARAMLPAMLTGMANMFKRLPTPAQAVAPAQALPDTGLRDAPLGLVPYRENAPTPPLVLYDPSGRTRDLSDYRGKLVVLSFWATWCPPCVREIPSLNRLQQHFDGQPLEVLGVNVGEDSKTIETFLESYEIVFSNLRDPGQRAYQDWNIYVVPSNFVLDREGRIRYGSVGAVDWDDREVREMIHRLLAENVGGQ